MTSSNLVLRRLVLLGMPLVLTVLMLIHPSPYEDLAGKLLPIAGWWLTIHTLQFVLFAFMGASIWLLTESLFQSSTKNRIFAIRIFAFIVALAAAAVALYWADAPRVPLFLLALPVYFISFDHAFPFGSLTFGIFCVAALWIGLGRGKHVSGEDISHPKFPLAPEVNSR